MGLPADVAAALTKCGGNGRHGGIPYAIRVYCYERDRYRCVNCRIKPQYTVKARRRTVGPNYVWAGRKIILTLDHIRRREHGGSNHPRNLRTLCRPCHEFLNNRDRLPDRGERPWATLHWIPEDE